MLPGVDGTPVQLSALRGRKVVLFFYPRDESPVCVVQVCAFRDAYEELMSAGVEVVGISSDSPESHHAFALQHQGRAHRILVNGACKRRALDALVESIVPGRRGDLRPPTAQELAVTAVLEFPLEEVSAKVRTGPPAENKEDYLLPFRGGVVPLRMVAGAPESDAAAVRARIAPPPYLGREGAERDVPDSPGTRLAARFRRRRVAWSTARSDTPPGAARRR